MRDETNWGGGREDEMGVRDKRSGEEGGIVKG
jgi:hypothetical protein